MFFVNGSARFSTDFTNLFFTIPSSTKSRMKNPRMSTCLIRFPPPLLAKHMAPTLSTFISMGNFTCSPRNSRTFFTNITSRQTSEAATNSSSLQDRVTNPCCLDPHEMRHPFNSINHPVILLRLSLSPPQSLSE